MILIGDNIVLLPYGFNSFRKYVLFTLHVNATFLFVSNFMDFQFLISIVRLIFCVVTSTLILSSTPYINKQMFMALISLFFFLESHETWNACGPIYPSMYYNSQTNKLIGLLSSIEQKKRNKLATGKGHFQASLDL